MIVHFAAFAVTFTLAIFLTQIRQPTEDQFDRLPTRVRKTNPSQFLWLCFFNPRSGEPKPEVIRSDSHLFGCCWRHLLQKGGGLEAEC